MREYEKIVALIKPKEVRVVNLDLMKPGQVVAKVAAQLGKTFKMHHHTLCYKHFNARPPKGADDPKACDTRYCIYDAAHKDYLYTQEWGTHLVKGLSDPATYEFLIEKAKGSGAGPPESAAAA